jgi:hypothetical protein
MTVIIRSQINSKQWVDTSGLALDGKDHFRERKQYGNRHAIFEIGALKGTVHVDEHNATDVPVGTFNHLAKYTHEKTGISETAARMAIGGLALFALFTAAKFLSRR